jgi:hypothetical protein
LVCVVHMTPAEVVSDPAYAQWMRSLNGAPQHVMCNAAACAGYPNDLTGAATLRVRVKQMKSL